MAMWSMTGFLAFGFPDSHDYSDFLCPETMAITEWIGERANQEKRP